MQLVSLYEKLRGKGMLERANVTAVVGASGHSVTEEVSIMTHICSDFLFRTGTVISCGSGIWKLSGSLNELPDRPGDEDPLAEDYVPPRHPKAPSEALMSQGFINPRTQKEEWNSRAVHLSKVVGLDVSSMVGLWDVSDQTMPRFEQSTKFVTAALALKNRTNLRLEAAALMVRTSNVSAPASIRALFRTRTDFEESHCGHEFAKWWQLHENDGVYPDFSDETVVRKAQSDFYLGCYYWNEY